MTAETQTRRLLEILAVLRDPQTGCSWDVVQDFASLAPYTIEEAYEVADAVARADYFALPDELGDLLLQVVYQCRLAEEASLFSYEDVAKLIAEKLVRRHPHIFGEVTSPAGAWEDHKEAERRSHAQGAGGEPVALAGIPINLPALTRALKLSARAARVGFEWPDVMQVMKKLDEEIGELRQELAGAVSSRMEDELGDILFTVANLARKLNLDPEACLRRANDKFKLRFDAMERKAGNAGTSLQESSLDQMEALWQQVKQEM